MKHWLALVCALCLVCALFTGCSADGKAAPPEEPVTVKSIALKGPTALGMVRLMERSEAGELAGNDYRFEIAAAVDEITAKLAKGEVDIAALPANLSSVLYNNTDGAIQVLAINTLGVLYILENGDTIRSVGDLRGRTVYASGKGATPEYALNYILDGNGLDPAADVTIEWKSEHAECLQALLADEDGVAMLPQPFVTTALAQSETLRVALDLTEEWDDLGTDSALITGVTVVRRSFAEEHPEAVAAFLDLYRDSVTYVNANTEAAAELAERFGIVPAAVAVRALPACNIVLLEGDELKDKLSGYLAVLMEQNPKSVGGALPGDDFYFSR